MLPTMHSVQGSSYLRLNDTNKIRGRESYQKRRQSEKDVDQPDGSHYEIPYNNSLEHYETLAMHDNEIDESDFSFQHVKEQQLVLPIKKRHIQETTNRSYERAQPPKSDKKPVHYPAVVKISITWKTIVAIALILVVFYILIWQSQAANEGTVTNRNDIVQFSKDLKILGKKFNLPNDSLLKIKVGVNTIHVNESTGSFIILYNSGAKNFHRSKFDEMLKDMSNATAKYLRNGNGNFIELEINNLKQANHQELMKSYESVLLQSGVMLVKDLDNLPTNLAMAFHYFCDEYNPLVKKTAIFFTVDKQKCSIHSNSEPHKWIEKCLAEKWRRGRDISEDSISPLLARVVEIVVEI